MALQAITLPFYYTGTRRVLTVPEGYKNSVTVHLWGAGGGSGAHDGGGYGARGAGGMYATATISVNPGDVIEIDVGGGGRGGSGGSSGPGGSGGASRLNIGSYNSFSGGTGGTAGPSGSSGGGGGGGGASLFIVNGSVALVAGGGAGGGGAGNSGSGGVGSNAQIGSGTAGANGAGHSGDGGAGGAGGGGLPGGNGGSGADGDTGGTGGYTGGGGSGASGATPGGTNIAGWVSPYGYAATAESASGADGMALIVFTPLNFGSVKVNSTWRPVQTAFVKVAGAWRTVVGEYVKVNGVWKELNQVGNAAINFISYADNFGVSGRAATGSEGSGGTGGGGGKIICTRLYEIGLLPKHIYEADQEFGQWLLENDPDVYNGYRAWAEIVVDWMSAKGPNIMLWILDDEMRMHRQVKWSTQWAEDIATPWAEEIAYRAGRTNRGNTTGKILMLVGVPISKAVGVWQRVFGPSKKPAGLIKGLALVSVFTLLKSVVVISNYVNKYKKSKEQVV